MNLTDEQIKAIVIKSIKNYLDKFFYQRIRNEIYPTTKISPITTKIGWITTYI